MSLACELVVDATALERLVPAWQDLWARCPAATPFQTPAWNVAWWRHLGHGQLWTVAVRHGESLVGIAPWFLYRAQATPEVRRLLFLGTSITDRLDVLVDPTEAQAALGALWGFLAARRDEWDLADLQELPQRSSLLDSTRLLPTRCEEGSSCPVVPLGRTAEEFHAGLPHGLRRNLRRYREQLANHGEVVEETATRENVGEMLDAFFRLHRAKWEHQGEPGVLADPHVERFHREVALAFLEQSLLRLHGLRCGQEIVAVVYAFAAHGRAYGYLGGFAPALARCSPGTLALGHALLEAAREGLVEWDFLRGQEAYKYHWGAVDRPNRRLVAWHDRTPPDALHD